MLIVKKKKFAKKFDREDNYIIYMNKSRRQQQQNLSIESSTIIYLYIRTQTHTQQPTYL